MGKRARLSEPLRLARCPDCSRPKPMVGAVTTQKSVVLIVDRAVLRWLWTYLTMRQGFRLILQPGSTRQLQKSETLHDAVTVP